MEQPFIQEEKLSKLKQQVLNVLSRRKDRRANLYYIYCKSKLTDIRLCEQLLNRLITEGTIKMKRISKENIYIIN
tara:strand:+ start:5668 stop:5892 length:225 start_codon:yes stop_codon:yes gene_type:complete